MPACSACCDGISGLVQFIFGWQDSRSTAWREFSEFVREQDQDALPAWVRFIGDATTMPLGPRLWGGFHPEDDPVEPYSKEEYRGWFRDFFKCQIQRSDDLDKKFFDGFAQMGADPLHWVEQFKADAQLRTWKEVIHCLGEICLKVTNPNVSYDRKLMGSLSDSFWVRVQSRPGGPALLRAIQDQPGEKKGLAHIKTAFYILQSCGFLETGKVSFSEWVDQEGASRKLMAAAKWNGDISAHLTWRASWSWSPSEPWGAPNIAYGVLKGIGENVFEYILRDHCYEGCLNLFKADSTNILFVKGTSLANHIPNSSARSKPDRKEYWQALYYSGILSVFPIAVINMAIYFAIAEGEKMEFYWKGTRRNLEAYNYLPIQLRVLDSRGCTAYSTI